MSSTPQRPSGCENCAKPAQTFFSFLVGDEEYKAEMCADCPHQKALEESGAHDVLKDLLPQLKIKQPEEVARVVETCPVCGFSMDDLDRTKRLGCAHCYEMFSRPVNRLVRAVQRGYKHVGKLSTRHQNQEALEERLSDLQSRLEDAVAKEAFENAASLRDEIRRILQAQTKISN